MTDEMMTLCGLVEKTPMPICCARANGARPPRPARGHLAAGRHRARPTRVGRPAPGAIVAEAQCAVTLTFSEPVRPLAARWFLPDGASVEGQPRAEGETPSQMNGRSHGPQAPHPSCFTCDDFTDPSTSVFDLIGQENSSAPVEVLVMM